MPSISKSSVRKPKRTQPYAKNGAKKARSQRAGDEAVQDSMDVNVAALYELARNPHVNQEQKAKSVQSEATAKVQEELDAAVAGIKAL